MNGYWDQWNWVTISNICVPPNQSSKVSISISYKFQNKTVGQLKVIGYESCKY